MFNAKINQLGAWGAVVVVDPWGDGGLPTLTHGVRLYASSPQQTSTNTKAQFVDRKLEIDRWADGITLLKEIGDSTWCSYLQLILVHFSIRLQFISWPTTLSFHIPGFGFGEHPFHTNLDLAGNLNNYQLAAHR
jgi:hypothetical protein